MHVCGRLLLCDGPNDLPTNYSILAPAFRPRLSGRSPTCEGRRRLPTAALTCSRRYVFGDEFASAVRCIALLLQWGGALGAYQAGVYEALSEADFVPTGSPVSRSAPSMVRSGNFVYLDTATRKIGPEHIMASAALPPGFPAVEIEGEHY
jgi:predicted acylesterase/phospholipase RssA